VKLRIKGNSLRLRVSRSELAQFLAGYRVEETIHLTPSTEARLTYALESTSSATEVGVRYVPQEITVLLPEALMQAWSEESEIGVYASIDIGNAKTLEVSIEKDFACLNGSDEENLDSFANPQAARAC
jgi:hypothetical protein